MSHFFATSSRWACCRAARSSVSSPVPDVLEDPGAPGFLLRVAP